MTSYGQHMIDMTEICTMVWAAPNLEDKKNLLRRAVESFKYREKRQEFLNKIAKANTTTCDFLASSLALNKSDKVVGLLPR